MSNLLLARLRGERIDGTPAEQTMREAAKAIEELRSRLDSILSAVGGACVKRHSSYLNKTPEGHFCHACGVIDGLAQQTCPLDRVVEKDKP